MLPKPEVLTRLMRANTSFVIYGQKASGKTRLIKSLFEQNKINYIEINCTLANKKSNFLRLFNVELTKQLRRRGLTYDKLRQPQNLDSWINEIKRIINESSGLVDELDNLYVFMDNIEQMVMSESFVPSFYNACQKQFPFRFNFIFCGTNFLKKQYTLELPFRTMMMFCQKKPQQEYEKIINQTVEKSLREHFKEKISVDNLERCTNLYTTQIKNSFDNIEYNLEKIKVITKAIVESSVVYIEDRDMVKALHKIIHNSQLHSIIRHVREHGPSEQGVMKRKLNQLDQDQALDVNSNLEYYPNLILSCIHLADYYQEKEDKRRFCDYKGRTNGRNKEMKKNDFKIGRHNINRIIAISDVIESQCKQNDKERALDHHSLDYYAQFQHLRKINRLKHIGNKITGIVKEEEAKAFLNKIDIKYQQFMGQ